MDTAPRAPPRVITETRSFLVPVGRHYWALVSTLAGVFGANERSHAQQNQGSALSESFSEC